MQSIMECPFKNYGTEDEPLFSAVEVARYINITHANKNLPGILKNFKEDEVIRNKLVKLERYKNNNKHEADFYINLLSFKGVQRLLASRRIYINKELLDYFDVPIYNRIIPDETEYINHIMTAFKGEQMISQYRVNEYRVDLYFPDYNLIIEVDENDHMSYNEESEHMRTNKINELLKGPQWIRFNPYKANIFEIINQIYIVTLKYNKK